ncbi:MAG: glycosyltransferase [Marinoscillum sp.]|nr:glycosyltransferase [Marinoscillum sp.]OUX26352.1 MAG: glycosyltransferase [Flammeovirgaceae bacterium TMED262]|tara:strand:- start:856 stop:1827 length:972 start_codon:yes stop_codon:yes gene_type:complete
MQRVDLSIVIPALDEEKSISELHLLITKSLDKKNINYEVIFVDDGSTDSTWNEIEKIINYNKKVKGIKFKKNYGKSDALDAAFKNSSGDFILTMDADLQDDPYEIYKLLEIIKNKKFDLVSGWKKKRNDPLGKTIPSKFFNYVTRVFSGIHLNDFNCGIKIYRREVIESIDLYGEMHRYIPLIAKWNGYNFIGEKVVNHNKRKFGKTKFGMERYVRGFLDLLSVSFVYRFKHRPMHFFGSLGVLFFLVGFVSVGLITYEKISKISQNIPLDLIRPVTDQPLFYVALVSIIIGVQLFLVGFLSELIIQINSDKKRYKIDKTKNV